MAMDEIKLEWTHDNQVVCGKVTDANDDCIKVDVKPVTFRDLPVNYYFTKKLGDGNRYKKIHPVAVTGNNAVDTSNGQKFYVPAAALVCPIAIPKEFCEKRFTKKDLKVGMIFDTREARYMVLPKKDGSLYYICSTYGYMLPEDYSDDLKYVGKGASYDDEFDIVEVFDLVSEPTNIWEHGESIWKRPPRKKMTKQEVEEKLGYEIEIVSNTEKEED